MSILFPLKYENCLHGDAVAHAPPSPKPEPAKDNTPDEYAREAVQLAIWGFPYRR